MDTMSTIAASPALTGTWAIDPVHSRVGFAVKHLGINTVRGRFDDFEGTLAVTEDFSTATVTGVIEAASIDTRFAMRDEHLRSSEFFDVENHPKISFVSTAITPIGGARFELSGEITIRGITKTIALAGEAHGTATDQFGNERVGLNVTGALKRSDFGMPYNETVAGIPLAADTINLSLDIEAIKQA
jgi:polyisoprenoid-binding protein YceI